MNSSFYHVFVFRLKVCWLRFFQFDDAVNWSKEWKFKGFGSSTGQTGRGGSLFVCKQTNESLVES